MIFFSLPVSRECSNIIRKREQRVIICLWFFNVNFNTFTHFPPTILFWMLFKALSDLSRSEFCPITNKLNEIRFENSSFGSKLKQLLWDLEVFTNGETGRLPPRKHLFRFRSASSTVEPNFVHQRMRLNFASKSWLWNEIKIS